ncbi:hypothetical protein VTL71DRAFT_18 [Oculimacula yallundae]|uniref:Carboxymuconolactone decarboxylase-like domain-containing protein n=1 Tax=Oculimacula yallundae TaxID=86028 RepID=A0ABR4D122_9HELO
MPTRDIPIRLLVRTRSKSCSALRYTPCSSFQTHPHLPQIHHQLLLASRTLRTTTKLSYSSSLLLSRTMATYREPTEEEAFTLFEAVDTKFPHNTLGEDAWYLVVLSAIVGAEPEHAVYLYKYLINKPQYSTSESRQTLVRRLREVLVKDVSILGVCKPLEALFSIAKIERPEDKDYSFSRENWQAGPETLKRGNNWLNTLYQANLSTPQTMFAAHKDFEYISRQITYGFYLSDHTILGSLETELVTLAGIMIQNLPLETAWHLRGTRRLGVSAEDVEIVQQCVEMVARYGGARMDKLPRVGAIEHEV